MYLSSNVVWLVLYIIISQNQSYEFMVILDNKEKQL